MARINNGFLGDAIGKLGNVVFRKWNSMITASQYQPNVNNPNSPAQQVQRNKIKNLALALKPFMYNVIPLNFNNNKGLSTYWAQAIKANYPLIDEQGIIEFKNFVLSQGPLLAPVILKSTYDPFIDQFIISYDPVNINKFPVGLLRATAIGKNIISGSFNTDNIARLPMGNVFSAYIYEHTPEYLNFNYTFENAWLEGMLWLNMVKSEGLDLRDVNPKNIYNVPSYGSYFEFKEIPTEFDLSVTERLILPENIHCEFVKIDDINYLRVFIDNYQSIPGLNEDDSIFIMAKVLTSDGNKYSDDISFTAMEGECKIPISDNDLEKPFGLLYMVFDVDKKMKSTITRFLFNVSNDITYCEMLFKNNILNPDSIKLQKPYTAIWGNLGDFIPSDIIPVLPLEIYSVNIATSEEAHHVINDKQMFLCSQLLINQFYEIHIKDSESTLCSFIVIGLDGVDSLKTSYKHKYRVIKYKAGSELASKVK